MNAITILILVVLVAALANGFRRGIVSEIGSLCAIVLALLACRVLGATATDVAARIMGVSADAGSMTAYSAAIVGHGALFLGVWLLVGMLARLLRGAVRLVFLGWLDRLLGALFCGVKWMLVLSLVLNVVHLIWPNAAMWTPEKWGELIKGVLEFAPWLFGVIVTAATAS